jgi:hypothetical protein
MSLVISLLLEGPGYLVEMVLPQTASQIFTELLSNSSSVVGGLFGSVCTVIFYYDIRSRKEGFDLEMLAHTRDQ